MRFFSCLILIVFLLHRSVCNGELKFYEEPTNTYLTKTTPAILKCKIENARTGFFKCNDQWSQDPINSKIVQIGNKQILFIEQAITKSQLDEFRKLDPSKEFWCTCQGWLNSADDTLISQKAFVKLAYIDQRFEWEPFPTSGLIGKSVEIRCLPPEGEPKPLVYWLKNNQLIEKTNKRMLISNEGSLLINEVRLTDSGNYTCIAENLAGKRLSDAAELTVTENKGWSDWSNWTECEVPLKQECGEGIQKRTRNCLNPPTINNAIGCDGFPQQVITCYLPCNLNNKPTSTRGLVLHTPSWTQWSAWSMTCNSDCMRTRQRECRINEKRPEKKCIGPEIELSNCTFECEPLKNLPTTVSIQSKSYMVYKQYFISTLIVIVLLSVLLIISIVIIRKCLLNKTQKKRECIQIELGSNDHYPIYYSVQPDYSQDHYMELNNTLLLTKQHSEQLKLAKETTVRKINEQAAYMKNVCACAAGSCCSGGDERCNASRNSSSTNTSSGSNSTTSSKIVLNVSPTDSLGKNFDSKQALSPLLTKSSQLDDYENNVFQIMKLINERRLQCPIMAKKNFNSISYDLFTFSIAQKGGFIEIPKFASYIMLPDETVNKSISTGVFKTNNQNILNLKPDQTILSSFCVIQTENQQKFAKPIILSFDHSAQFAESDWDTSIFYKSPSQNDFEEINEQIDETIYSHIVSNRCFIMTEKDGIYALVGRPKPSSLANTAKEMKYAILLVNGTIKVYILQNTRAATEIFNDEIHKTNGKIIKMPETFELHLNRQSDLENLYLSLDVNVNHRNELIYDSIMRKMRLLEIWNTSKDFIEIEVPIAVNSIYSKDSSQFDLSVQFKLEETLIFSYTSSNANASDLHTVSCAQQDQEFYSSVSVNPMFLPINISGLLDEYVLRCFKMNTLKKNDWNLFANLLKCDMNVQYFANKGNSFELMMSLWLMINLNRSSDLFN